MIKKQNIKNNKGIILSSVLVFTMIAIPLIIALTAWFGTTLKSVRTLVQKEQSFHIAEAGIDFYKWHLDKDPDFLIGEDPLIQDFYDKEGNLVGNFSINVYKESDILVVESTGNINNQSNSDRTIRVKFSRPSFLEYAFISDSPSYFREGTEVFGRVHSNGGIRFDGFAHNLISSAKDKYIDSTHDDGVEEFGVHTHYQVLDPYPPEEVPERLDVFSAGREFPVSAIDFNSLTFDFSELKTETQNGNGLYFSESGENGYVIDLKTDGTFDLYKAENLENSPGSCVNQLEQDDWGTWSIKQNDLEKHADFVANYEIPDDGTIFLEDHVWVQGQVDDVKVTIVAATLPDVESERKNIIINNDVLYTNYDGSDSIVLIAQNNINIGLMSEDDLRIDAALIAQNGRVGRYYYGKPGQGQSCATEETRSQLTLYGTVISKEQFGFSYDDDSGYQTRNINYDPNLKLRPPKDIPTISGDYRLISWEEI
ncbi:hypothetical protein GW764_03535 [Candidatus Parcubacteria bacterium]|nr:hypothetical protein [Candidatus Parcubacteria bacterium]